MSSTNEWSPAGYEHHAGYVAELGEPLLALLAPRPGERILDLGCGDGRLTQKIAASGATVVGIDGSAEMVEAARGRGIDAHVMDARALGFDGGFDAVFSNAALHWIPEAEAVLAGVAKALKPGGRLVAELGGFGNIAAIRVALIAVLERRGMDGAARLPWFYPTADSYRRLLEAAGFEVGLLELFPRPTPLPTGMRGWLETFTSGILSALAPQDRARALDETVALLRPVLCDEDGRWTADYVRLRVAARRAATSP